MPIVAVALNHDTISFVLIVAWVAIIIPLCILQAIDFFRDNHNPRLKWLKNVVRIPIFLFGLVSSLAGVGVIAWCLYNVVIQRLAEYSGPKSGIELWMNGFGIGPVLASFGWYLLRLSLSHVRQSGEKTQREERNSF